jgi:hypothetical protein
MLDTSKKRLQNTLMQMSKQQKQLDAKRVNSDNVVKHKPNFDKMNESFAAPFDILESKLLSKHEKMQQELR